MTDDVRIRLATRGEWERLHDLRLRSLADAPDAFGSTLEHERGYGETAWVGWIEGWEGARHALFVGRARHARGDYSEAIRLLSGVVSRSKAMWSAHRTIC